MAENAAKDDISNVELKNILTAWEIPLQIQYQHDMQLKWTFPMPYCLRSFIGRLGCYLIRNDSRDISDYLIYVFQFYSFEYIMGMCLFVCDDKRKKKWRYETKWDRYTDLILKATESMEQQQQLVKMKGKRERKTAPLI